MPRHADRTRREATRDTPRAASHNTEPAGADSPQARANHADRTTARSAQLERANAAPVQCMPAGTGVIQCVKYIWRKGHVLEVEDDYKKKPKERWSTEEAFAASHGGGDAMDAKRQAIRDRQEAERLREAAARRKAERQARRARVTPGQLPAAHQGKQTRFPGVVGSADSRPADLVYRGMSVNNVRNLQQDAESVFTAQAPTGTATALEHVVDDSEASPWLSFEAGGLDISAGKYAAKPVDPDTRKPLGVTRKEGGFLKQEKSYTAKSRRDYPRAKRIGYVGGITRDAGTEQLDVSDDARARRAFAAAPGETGERRQKAIDLAKADKEVLVKPGASGIAPAKVPFVSKVKEVDEAYYRKHVARQTPTKALGYYKAFDENPTYVKMQIPSTHTGYKFGVPADLRREDDDSEAEMSDIEDIDLSDYT